MRYGLRRSKAFTLLEVLVASAILGTALAAAFEMFSSGNQQVVKGISTTTLIQSALVLEQAVMHDVQRMMVPDKVAPVELDLSGTYVSFYVPQQSSMKSVFRGERGTSSTTSTWCVTGVEVRWHLVEAGKSYFHPTRNDKVFNDLWLKSWRFTSARPGTPSTAPAPATTGTSGTPGSPVTTGLELDRSRHPLTPELRKRLGFPPAKLPPQGTAPPTGGSTAATSPATSPAPYLLLEYTLVDPVRKQELKRSLIWDLVNVRSKATFGGLYVMPDGILTYRPRRRIKVEVEGTFDAKWEKEPER